MYGKKALKLSIHRNPYKLSSVRSYDPAIRSYDPDRLILNLTIWCIYDPVLRHYIDISFLNCAPTVSERKNVAPRSILLLIHLDLGT